MINAVGGSGTADDLVINAGNVADEIRLGGLTAFSGVVTLTVNAGLDNDTVVGSAIGDVINGQNGNDSLLGGDGNDRLLGGFGDDLFIAGAGDVVIEAVGQGRDTVSAATTWVLGLQIEDLVLTGSSAINGTGSALGNRIIGNDAVNVLNGGAGNDTLDGGLGIDRLFGGGDDDLFIVGTGDLVFEFANLGNDTVQSSINWTLAANLEVLRLTGAVGLVGTGNALGNLLVGGDGADTLNGGAGADTFDGGAGIDRLVGGANDDTYILGDTPDVVVEGLNQGIDTILTTRAALVLAANVENATATNAIAHNFTGNALGNVLTGNTGVDLLNGGVGDDTLDGRDGFDQLLGSLGDDIFIVTAGDLVFEGANQGTDTVFVTTGTNATLALNVENLVLAGPSLVNGTGNTLANSIVGNDRGNLLQGVAGDDVIDGGLGNDILIGGLNGDTLTGGGGSDQFRYTSVNDSVIADRDLILDFTFSVALGVDRVDLRLIDANSLVAGDQAFVYVGAFTGVAGQLTTLAIGPGVFRVLGDTNGNGSAEFVLDIASATAPTGGWFLL